MDKIKLLVTLLGKRLDNVVNDKVHALDVVFGEFCAEISKPVNSISSFGATSSRAASRSQIPVPVPTSAMDRRPD